MTRMNKKQHDEMYWKIVEKQKGEFCNHCDRTRHLLMSDGLKPELIIDCIPNDGDHSNVEKLQLLCRSCNTKKNHPANVEPFERSATPEMIRGNRYENDFRRWVVGHYQVNTNIGLTYSFLINSGAEKVGCSTETIKRYLNKMSSDEGMYTWENRSGSEPLLVLKEMYRD